MSPWIKLKRGTSYPINTKSDVISANQWRGAGKAILSAVPKSDINYVDISQLPVGWFTGVNDIIEKVLITTGEKECLRDDIVNFSTTFSKSTKGLI